MADAEIAYYRGLSGLPASATLAEHKLATWRADAAVADSAGYTEAEHEFLVAKTGLARGTGLSTMRLAYFSALSGLGAGFATTDHMAVVYAGGGGPGPSAGYGLGPYGTMPYGQ